MSTIRIQSTDRTWSADTAAGARVFRIGRDESADIVVLDPAVSRRHAEIRAVGDGWELVDVGSSLGTWVNGRRVDRVVLTGTSAVGFGDQGRSFTVTVTVTGAATGGPPPHGGPGSAAAPTAYAPPPAQPPAGPPPAAAPVAPRQVPPAPAPPAGAPGFQTFERLPSTPYDPLAERTMVTGPGGFGAPPGLGGPGLLVRRRHATDLRFPGGVPVRVGRDPSLEVHADDQAVSRLHAVLEPRPDGWWWVDRSTSGTFVDGERRTAFKVDEPVELSLGHPTAGYELEVVPVVAAGEAAAGLQRRKRRRTLVVVGAAVLALVAVTGLGLGAWAILDDDPAPVAGGTGGDGDAPPPADPDDPEARAAALDRAKAATVLLQAVDDAGQVLWSGSGSVISDDGLVLTNAHVGDPDAPGQGSSQPDPAFLEVSLTTGDDDAPAQARYRATPIVSDGYLDVAVLQIDADLDGTALSPDELDLPEPLPVGDSDALRTGDRIIALGYPAIGNVTAQGDRPLTVTEGVVSTFQKDEVVGTDRGSIDSDVRLGSGNSGGPSINQAGEIIGLNTRVITAASMDAGSITQGSALIVPVNLAEAVLEIAEQGGDPDYVSPYLSSMPTDPGLPTDATVVAAGWSRAGESGSCRGTSSSEAPSSLPGVGVGDEVAAEFAIEGLPDGLPFAVDFFLDDGSRVDTLSGSWEGGSGAVCVSAPLTVQGDVPGVTAVFSLGQGGEVAAVNPVVFG